MGDTFVASLAVFLVIGICVILPIAIVWIIVRGLQNKSDREAEVLIRSMESGHPLDQESIRRLRGRGKPLKIRLLNRLTVAIIATLLGIVYYVQAFIEAKMYHSEVLDYDYLLTGGFFLAIGIAFFVAYFLGKRMLAKEIEAEEQDGEYRK